MKTDKKELIRQAAVEVIARNGFYNTRADQIAEEAGVAVGTIYNYFSNKEEILEYIFEVELKKRMAYLEEIRANDGQILEQIQKFLGKHFTEIRENPKVGEILVKEKQFPHRNQSNSIVEYLHLIPARLTFLLKEGARQGQLRECNYELVGASLFGAIQGLVETAVMRNNPKILESAAEELVELWLNGLKNNDM